MIEIKETEKGKAIIQLAQIIMILAGFLFATSGVAYTNSIATTSTISSSVNELTSTIINLNNKTLPDGSLEALNNSIIATQLLIKSVDPQFDLVEIAFLLGAILAVISIIIWGWGYNKIKGGFWN